MKAGRTDAADKNRLKVTFDLCKTPAAVWRLKARETFLPKNYFTIVNVDLHLQFSFFHCHKRKLISSS